MKKLTMYSCHLALLALLSVLFSCEREVDDHGGVTDKVPGSVTLSDYSASTITVGWERTEGTTSYTVQLLEAKDSDAPLKAYTTTTKNFYQFNGLEETRGYYIRVRANVNYATGQWVYLRDASQRSRIMPKYGFVEDGFVPPVPKPEPQLYPNFPEGWEVHGSTRKASHTANGPTGRQSDVFPSGEWLMPNMYTNSASAIEHKVGSWAVMMNTNVATKLEMDFDLPNGARKFSFLYGVATKTNANETALPLRIELTVEYSQDSGLTWTVLGDVLVVDDLNIQYFKEYELDIQGPVRFRIGKNNSRARPMIDEIAVYY